MQVRCNGKVEACNGCQGKEPHEKTNKCGTCGYDKYAKCVEIDPLEMHSPEVRVALTS